ncbi:MAG: hypothetical protein O3C57_02075 [Verrucomicrobia bacterium]|nr:hypothetical protein [Verrucomicrobiota bacterium]
MRTFIKIMMLATIALPLITWGQQVIGFHEAQSAERRDWIPFSLQGETVWVNPDVSVTLTSAPSAELRWRTPAAPVVVANDPPGLQITLSEVDRTRFADLTTHVTGRRLAVLHNGHILSAPFVEGPIVGGRVIIYGIQDASITQHIAAQLRARP